MGKAGEALASLKAIADGAVKALHPHALREVVRSGDLDDLTDVVNLYALAKDTEQAAWIAQATIAGEILDSELITTEAELADVFGCHLSLISRQVSIYRKILAPRIDVEGEAATFPLRFRSYYEVALEAERHSGADPQRLIRRAEDEASAAGYSTTRFREELAAEGLVPAAPDPGTKGAREEQDYWVRFFGAITALRGLAKEERNQIRQRVATMDFDGMPDIEEAMDFLETVRDAREDGLLHFGEAERIPNQEPRRA